MSIKRVLKEFVMTVAVIMLSGVMAWAMYIIVLYLNCWIAPNCTIGRG